MRGDFDEDEIDDDEMRCPGCGVDLFSADEHQFDCPYDWDNDDEELDDDDEDFDDDEDLS